MKLWAILPALILAGALRAQTPAAKPGSVDGVVTNSTTGEPVKKALVMLQGTTAAGAMGKTSNTATTDASGHFHFGNVQPGSYSVIWERDGFMPPGSGLNQSFPRVTVSEEQDVKDVAIKLVPMGAVSGHLFDEDGEPILRAQVAVLRYFYSSGRKQLSQVASAQSNDLGEFEAINLQPGRYYFQADAQPPRNIPPHTRWTRPEEAYPSTFYPNAREASQASGTDVAAGAHVSNIDFRLRKMPAYHIRGTVLGESGGQPGAAGQVMVEADSKFLETIAQSGLQTDGSFDVRGVVNGAYQLSYMRFSQNQPPPSYSSQPVRVSDGDVNGVVLTRRPELEVSGTVTVEGAQPEKLGLVVALSSVQGMGQGGSSEVGADGRIAMTDVPAELYELQLYNVPPGKYVKSIRLGDREIKGGEIDLSAGSSASLNILLGEDGGEVDGNVQTAGGQPAPLMHVTLAPAEESNSRADLLKSATTDASGNFQIKDVAPGEYKVFAWESDPDGSTQSAEFRKPFESKSASVTVGPKSKASAQLSLIAAGDIQKEMSKLP